MRTHQRPAAGNCVGILGAGRGVAPRTVTKRTSPLPCASFAPGSRAAPSQEVGVLADQDLRLKGKPAREFGAQSSGRWRSLGRLVDHERARRADAHGIEMAQLFGERARPEGPMTADVDAAEEDDGHGHTIPYASCGRNAMINELRVQLGD